jgi:hypothetical protein
VLGVDACRGRRTAEGTTGRLTSRDRARPYDPAVQTSVPPPPRIPGWAPRPGRRRRVARLAVRLGLLALLALSAAYLMVTMRI